VAGVFPNDPAVVRLIGTVLLEQNGEWRKGARVVI